MEDLPTGSTSTLELEKVAPKSKTLPQWNVVLLDDNYHTYEYVILMLSDLFGHPIPLCQRMAEEVDSTGRVIVFSTHRERAELERDRILGYGADPRIPQCKGSMSAIIEPAFGS
jgi:ATP-dependent Clp protease adaptor protein ClpS